MLIACKCGAAIPEYQRVCRYCDIKENRSGGTSRGFSKKTNPGLDVKDLDELTLLVLGLQQLSRSGSRKKMRRRPYDPITPYWN